MKLTVLGCSGTFPGPSGPCSSYLVEHDGFRLLLDAGNGAIGALQRHVGLFDLDAVVLTHLHGDHCIDLVAYSYARRYGPDGLLPALPVYGPAGTQDRLCAAIETEPPDHLADIYDFRVLQPGPVTVGPFTLTAARMDHVIECLGVRVEAGGRSLAYSGDTGPCAALVELARGVDLFLCEASWLDGPDHPPSVHLTAREAGEHATAAGARALVLTHLVEAWGDSALSLAQAKRSYHRDLYLATPDAVFDI